MFNRFKVNPLATLSANPIVFPGTREMDTGKVRMGLELLFDNVEKAKEFMRVNNLSTVIFDRKR